MSSNILRPAGHKLVRVGNKLHPITHSFVVKRNTKDEPPPPNGFIFEFYNSAGNANIVTSGSANMLENAMTASGPIWTNQDAWQAMAFEVRIRNDTQWQWGYFPHEAMQYHNVYSTITGAGNKTWVPGVPTMRQEARGQPSKVNGLTWDEVMDYPGLLADGMWHHMPVRFPFPHLQWRERDGHPGMGVNKNTDVWVWNFEYHCACRWWDDPCTCVLYPDYVCWLRGGDDSRISSWFRNTPIDGSLFPPSSQGWTWNPTGGAFRDGEWESNRTSGVKRLPLEHWHRPWKRYPHLA